MKEIFVVTCPNCGRFLRTSVRRPSQLVDDMVPSSRSKDQRYRQLFDEIVFPALPRQDGTSTTT